MDFAGTDLTYRMACRLVLALAVAEFGRFHETLDLTVRQTLWGGASMPALIRPPNLLRHPLLIPPVQALVQIGA
jgi:hypothetical protein